MRYMPRALALAIVTSALASAAPGASARAGDVGYRKPAAQHIYFHNQHRVFRGRMPPLLYAVGVLQVEVDARGYVRGTAWLRAPSHAPEVMAEIERSVWAASPFPAPGRTTYYVDTWLWDRSGQFQLDTLTEGQD